MTYIKIVILDGLDVAMNPNVAVATAESDEQTYFDLEYQFVKYERKK